MIKLRDRVPLECFRVFNVAAKSENFSAAGRVLCISQAAVSQRIRQLEDHVGVKLFTREGRTVQLTPQGKYLLRRTVTLFDYLDETLSVFENDPVKPPVSIAASAAVSHFWLADQLQEFSKFRPDIAVKLVTTDAMDELSNTEHNLAIFYARGDRPAWDLTPLLHEILVPAAHESYLEKIGNPGLPMSANDISKLDLLSYEKLNPHWITLRDWFIRQKVDAPASRVAFSSYALTLDAAMRGQGVMLFSETLVPKEGTKPRLTALSDKKIISEFHYQLGKPRDKTLSVEANELYTFLKRAGSAFSSLPKAP